MDEGWRDDGGVLPRRGRLRRRENEPPPLWFGLVFLLAGLGTAWLGVAYGGGALPILAFGGFFALLGAGMSLTTITAQRGRRPAHAAGAAGPVDVFTRSPMRILMDLVLAPIGSLAFFGAGAACGVLFFPLGLVMTLGFGFFGLIMAVNASVTMRRGARRAVAEVGLDGIWTPELPRRLGWSEIDRLEVEHARGAAGDAGMAIYTRLGIWPRDPAMAARMPGRWALGLVRGFTGAANRQVPGGRGFSDPALMAPFGIQAFDLEQDFDEVLRSVGRYAPIVGVSDEPDGVVPSRVIPPTPAPDGLLGAILANVSTVAAGPTGSREAAADEGARDLPQPGPLTFRRPEGLGWGIGEITVPLLLIGVPLLMIVFPLASGLNPFAVPLAWLFYLFPLGFLAWGIVMALELPSRLRMRFGSSTLVTVDEQGIEMRGMGRLAWSEIADVRVVRSPMAVGEGQPAIRRIEIVPLDATRLAGRPWPDRAYDAVRAAVARLPLARRRRGPGAFGLDLDLVAEPEGLLDAIARYRLVDER